MDDTQHFCLRWNNYQSSITSAFENLRDDEAFVDVTLACEGRSIKAHRVVLSACSPYFRELLKSTPCKHPVILLQDVNFMDLHALVEFIYHGEVNVHQKSLQSFLKTAEVLRVSGLTQQQAEDTHSHLAQIQNLANSGGRTPLNTHTHSQPHPHHGLLHDDGGSSTLFSRQGAGSPPPTAVPSLPSHINNQLLKRMAMMHRSSAAAAAEESSHAHKRLRGSDNGLPLSGAVGSGSNNNSPDLPPLHARSASPQQTPADFSTIKHHNNNNTPPLKEEKRNGPTGNGNGNSGNGNGNGNGNGASNGNGISISDKLGSLTPSPLARAGADDVKSEPMELVCSNNNANVNDEHSNDSTGEHDANRSSSGDGGKGSLSSGNDEEIGDGLASHHAAPQFIMSPAENKMFHAAAFNFSNIDPSALLGLNTQLQQSADLSVSPQGPHSITRSAATSPTSSTSSPPSPPTALISPTSSLKGSLAAAVYSLQSHAHGHVLGHATSPPRPGSVGSSVGSNLCTSTSMGCGVNSGNNNCGNNNGNNANSSSNNGNATNNNNNSSTSPGSQAAAAGGAVNQAGTPPLPLRMPPPTSGGINEPQECPYCRRTFSCYYSLKRHFQDKHEQSDTLYVCEFCHRRYRTKNSLTTHKSLQHRGSSGMLKRLLKTTAIKHGLVGHGHGHGHVHHPHPHHHALSHPRTSLYDFTSELGQPPPGIQ